MIQRTPDVTGTDFIYDVGVSVGAGGYNYKEDTMLVQYFMCHIALVASLKGDSTFADLSIMVDGIVGPDTLKAIRTYQDDKCYYTDGRVDPSQEAIVNLNNDFRNAYPNLDPHTPATWPAPPPLLAAALARIAAQ
jgi:hypothetical protein